MAESTIKKQQVIFSQAATVTLTGGSGWHFVDVTFQVPYKSLPAISFYPNTLQGNPEKMPAIYARGKSGFKIGYYDVTGTFQFDWVAIGEI